jgi:HEAT repeat protein
MARSTQARYSVDQVVKEIRRELLGAQGLSASTLDEAMRAVGSGEDAELWLRPFLAALGYRSSRARKRAARALDEILGRSGGEVPVELVATVADRCLDVMEREEEMDVYELLLSILERSALALKRAGYSDELARITKVLTKHLNVLYTSPFGRRIVELLGSIGDRMALHSLVLCLGKHEIREDASRSLAKARRKSVPPLLETLRTHEDPEVRARIADLLWAMGEDATDLLAAEAVDMRWFVRRNVCHVLAHLGARRALPLLRRLAEDRDRRVRLAAIRAAGELVGKGARKIIVDALEDSDVGVRQEAKSLLA